MIGKDEDSLFAADEQMRYRKKSQKKAPRKINHRHEFAYARNTAQGTS